jgi:hypothetical protein
MKRTAIGFLLLAVLVFSATSDAQRQNHSPRTRPPAAQGTVNIPCDPGIMRIEDCSDVGCSNERAFDPKLNQQKNIRASSSTPTDKDFSFLSDRPDPGNDFVEGGSRDALTALGEGQMIRVVAFAVDVRRGSKESCNCGLSKMQNTDNHIVLIDPADRSPSLADEEDSETAEFTPRVRLDHPNLSRTKLRPLILAASRQALKVRVTGLQMFDSFHFFHAPLTRHNNWEIHPVFHLEYCPRRKHCEAGSDANWVNLEQ